jgi:hypothetical protein
VYVGGVAEKEWLSAVAGPLGNPSLQQKGRSARGTCCRTTGPRRTGGAGSEWSGTGTGRRTATIQMEWNGCVQCTSA